MGPINPAPSGERGTRVLYDYASQALLSRGLETGCQASLRCPLLQGGLALCSGALGTLSVARRQKPWWSSFCGLVHVPGHTEPQGRSCPPVNMEPFFRTHLHPRNQQDKHSPAPACPVSPGALSSLQTLAYLLSHSWACQLPT